MVIEIYLLPLRRSRLVSIKAREKPGFSDLRLGAWMRRPENHARVLINHLIRDRGSGGRGAGVRAGAADAASAMLYGTAALGEAEEAPEVGPHASPVQVLPFQPGNRLHAWLTCIVQRGQGIRVKPGSCRPRATRLNKFGGSLQPFRPGSDADKVG
jgi:hypothetical protein